MGGEDHRDVGEQRQRRPFENRCVAGVAYERLQQDTDDAEQHGVELGRSVDQQPCRRAHGAKVRAEIDHVGDEQQQDDAMQKPWRIMSTQVAGDADTRDASDPCADVLNDNHEGQAEKHDPGKTVAELGSHLTVGCDAARIVVGGTRDEARTQLAQEARWLRGRTDQRGTRRSINSLGIGMDHWEAF